MRQITDPGSVAAGQSPQELGGLWTEVVPFGWKLLQH